MPGRRNPDRIQDALEPVSLPILIALLLPGLLFLVLSLLWLLGPVPGERGIARTSQGVALVSWILFSLETIPVLRPLAAPLRLDYGDWFASGHAHFGLSLSVDPESLPMLWLTALLTGLVASFSIRYLHRDRGFLRFFSLLNLFTFGAYLVAAAGSLDVLTVGWELVGITSVLLIGFFQLRPEPVQNAARVFAYYRIADVFLIASVLLSHLWFGTARIDALSSTEVLSKALDGTGRIHWIALFLILAACGKSSIGPFFGWLPRAMEGPTPSSAIFYGAISVHLGAFLLLRVQPLILASGPATLLLIVMGLGSAFLGTLLHRSSCDAKTSLSHATQSQLGLIFVEIALGWVWIPMLHILGHSIVRTAQFLRAPSMLHDHHHVHAAAGGRLDPTGSHLEALVPRGLQVWLYRIAIDGGTYETLLNRFLLGPVLALARFLAVLEPPAPSPSGMPSGNTSNPGRQP